MALIRCPECNKKISSTASACPRCGYQISPEEREEAAINGEKEKPIMSYAIIASSVTLLLLIVFTANAYFGWFGNDPTTSKGMVRVIGGSFRMGSNDGESDEKPVHTVKLTYDYWMGKCEVTNANYRSFLNERGVRSDGSYNGKVLIEMSSSCEFEYKNGGFVLKSGKGERTPIMCITWWGAIEYCNWLSGKEGVAKAYDSNGNLLDKNGNITTDITKVEGYRLPTEAEWEYAARGGQNTKGHKYAGSDDLDEVGWYWQNAGDKWLPGTDSAWDGDKILANKSKTHPVGKKKPNELGLYDMSGNVYEWCHDWFWAYTTEEKENPTGPGSVFVEFSRVLRGGSWFYGGGQGCRVAARSSYIPVGNAAFIGFRISRTAF